MVFLVELVLAILTFLMLLLPDFMSLIGPNILLVWGLLILSGGILVFVTHKSDLKRGKPKTFLLISGFSAVGFVLGVILHNAFYALAILAKNIPLLPAVMNVLEVAFFLIAVILSPLGLLVGLVGTLVFWKQFDQETP